VDFPRGARCGKCIVIRAPSYRVMIYGLVSHALTTCRSVNIVSDLEILNVGHFLDREDRRIQKVEKRQPGVASLRKSVGRELNLFFVA
jgi:hypothetical protein